MSFFTKQHATVTFSDGAGTPASITFDDVGDSTIDGLQEAGKGTASIFHRGAFKSYVYTDEAPVTGSFSLTLKAEDFSNASSSRPLDFIMKLGSVASGTTTNPGGFGPGEGLGLFHQRIQPRPEAFLQPGIQGRDTPDAGPGLCDRLQGGLLEVGGARDAGLIDLAGRHNGLNSAAAQGC